MAEVLNATEDFVTASERRTAELFRTLPDSWFVVANKMAATMNGTFEMDFIIVADHRIVIVDDKYWRGPITGSDLKWTLQSSEQRNSPLNIVDNYARQLRGFIGAKGIQLPETPQVKPIVGAVFVSYPNATISIRDHRQAKQVFTTANVMEKLLELDAEGNKAGLALKDIRAKLRTALYDTDERNLAMVPKAINTFDIIERIEQRGQTQIYGAINSSDQQPYRLYVYQPQIGEKPEEFDREVEALQKLQNTGVVPRVNPPISIGDHGVRMVSIAMPSGVSWGALELPTNAKEALKQIDLSAGAFASLARIHESGVTHRGVDPSRVFVSGWPNDPRVVFTDFVFSRIQDATKTIASEIDALAPDDPYAAPEIRVLKTYSAALQSSDIYSLALVALERISGFDARAIRQGAEETGELTVDDGWRYLPQDVIAALAEGFLLVLTRDPYGAIDRPNAREFSERLREIAQQARQPRPESAAAPESKYEILAKLGQGSFAETFRVVNPQVGYPMAAKKYRKGLNSETLESIKKEFLTLVEMPGHPNLPKVFPPDLSNPDFQFFMEYIEGESLASKISTGPLGIDDWANVMRGLLGAVGHLMRNNVVHRDIKPENIIIRDRDGMPILIDFGSAALQGRKTSGAGSPAYMPPESWSSTQPTAGFDLYGAAMTLLEAANCRSPFEPGTRVPISTLPEEIPQYLHAAARVLLKAIAYDPASRFSTGEDLQRALEVALVSKEEPEPPNDEITPDNAIDRSWPTLLRGLFRGSSRGNGDNRGLDSGFAKSTYVQTRLDTHLWPAVVERRPAVVFLSGNPGDGKTAFLEEIREKLRNAGASGEATSDPSGWELTLDGHEFRACFDASESSSGRNATEQLRNRLRGIEGESPVAKVTVLVAINDGRLAEVANELQQSFPWLTQFINKARQHRLAPPKLQDPVWIVDLKRRAYISLAPQRDESSVWRAMLNSMIDRRHWPSDPESIKAFPPAQNAEALRNPMIVARLEYLFLLSHLRGDRHTTVRDLRSALAMIITGDLDYDNVKDRLDDPETRSWTYAYWNITFTTNSSRDLVLGDLRWLDPARFAHPELERYLYFHRRTEDAAERAKLFINGIDETPPPGDDPALIRDWMAAVKRRLFFEGAVDRDDAPVKINPMELVPYRSASEMIAVLSGASDGSGLLQALLLGIGCSDGIAAARQIPNDLVLGIKRAPTLNLEVVTTLPESRFSLRPEVAPAGESEVVEVTPRTILLQYQSDQMGSVAPLRLNLDLVEVLSRLAKGLEPTSEELNPILEEIAPFKSRLQRDVSNRLLVLDGNRGHWIEKDGDRLIRRDSKV